MSAAHLAKAEGSGLQRCACGHHYASHGHGIGSDRWHVHTFDAFGRIWQGECPARTGNTQACYRGCVACRCGEFHADYEADEASA